MIQYVAFKFCRNTTTIYLKKKMTAKKKTAQKYQRNILPISLNSSEYKLRLEPPINLHV